MSTTAGTDIIARAYCDGGVMGSNPSSLGGAWAWCHVTDIGAMVNSASGVLTPTPAWPQITNNYAEFVAALRAIEALPDNWGGELCSDSEVTLGRLCNGWSMSGIPAKLINRMYAAKARLQWITPVLLDGHPTKEEVRRGIGRKGRPVSVYNVWCDRACTLLMQDHMAALRTQEGTGATERHQEPRLDPEQFPHTHGPIARYKASQMEQ